MFHHHASRPTRVDSNADGTTRPRGKSLQETIILSDFSKVHASHMSRKAWDPTTDYRDSPITNEHDYILNFQPYFALAHGIRYSSSS